MVLKDKKIRDGAVMAIDNKKEQERAELHRTIWAIANDLRGSVDGWDFKQYVLGMLFYRYISENLTAYINQRMTDAGYDNFEYANYTDRTSGRSQRRNGGYQGLLHPSFRAFRQCPQERSL